MSPRSVLRMYECSGGRRCRRALQPWPVAAAAGRIEKRPRSRVAGGPRDRGRAPPRGVKSVRVLMFLVHGINLHIRITAHRAGGGGAPRMTLSIVGAPRGEASARAALTIRDGEHNGRAGNVA